MTAFAFADCGARRQSASPTDIRKRGYLTLHEMLKREGRVVNRKRTCRLYREEGLRVRAKLVPDSLSLPPVSAQAEPKRRRGRPRKKTSK